jgi:hypothetical protein
MTTSDFMHRNRVVFWLLSFALLATLAACAGPRVAGSEIGGTVPMIGATQEQALKLAQAHCSNYGRSARILSIRAEEGGKAVFECF